MDRKLVLSVAMLLALPFLLPCRALADKHIVEEVTLRASQPGQEDRSATIETWLATGRFARIDNLNNITTIVRSDTNKMYLVLHDSKTVVETDLPFTLPDELETLFEEVKMTWILNNTNERKQIGRWQARKVELQGRGVISIDIEMWVNNETGVDTRSFHSMVGEALRASPLYRDLAIQLDSLGSAFSIATTTTVIQMGITTTTESAVKSIDDEQPATGIYAPPDDYKKETLNFSSYLALVRDRYRP